MASAGRPSSSTDVISMLRMDGTCELEKPGSSGAALPTRCLVAPHSSICVRFVRPEKATTGGGFTCFAIPPCGYPQVQVLGRRDVVTGLVDRSNAIVALDVAQHCLEPPYPRTQAPRMRRALRVLLQFGCNLWKQHIDLRIRDIEVVTDHAGRTGRWNLDRRRWKRGNQRAQFFGNLEERLVRIRVARDGPAVARQRLKLLQRPGAPVRRPQDDRNDARFSCRRLPECAPELRPVAIARAEKRRADEKQNQR